MTDPMTLEASLQPSLLAPLRWMATLFLSIAPLFSPFTSLRVVGPGQEAIVHWGSGVAALLLATLAIATLVARGSSLAGQRAPIGGERLVWIIVTFGNGAWHGLRIAGALGPTLPL